MNSWHSSQDPFTVERQKQWLRTPPVNRQEEEFLEKLQQKQQVIGDTLLMWKLLKQLV